jgi:DinB superfamily
MQETPQQYTQRMLGNVEGQDPLRVQRSTPAKLAKLIRGLGRKKLARRPAPERWSIAEILAHLADGELVVGCRIRQIFGRNAVPIHAFDQDVWATTFKYRSRDAKASLETFRVLRESNLALLKAVPKKLWENYGVHEERGPESVAHILRMLAGHDLNHLRQVEGMVKTKPRRGRGKT